MCVCQHRGDKDIGGGWGGAWDSGKPKKVGIRAEQGREQGRKVTKERQGETGKKSNWEETRGVE